MGVKEIQNNIIQNAHYLNAFYGRWMRGMLICDNALSLRITSGPLQFKKHVLGVDLHYIGEVHQLVKKFIPRQASLRKWLCMANKMGKETILNKKTSQGEVL